MKPLYWLLLIMLILLAGCQPANLAANTPLPPTFTPEEIMPSPEPEAYPAPQDWSPEGYPYPPAISPSSEGAYPAPQNQKTVPGGDPPPEQEALDLVAWEEAKNLLLAGQVEQVAQFHDLTVVLTLKDGRTIRTREPAIDDVFKLIDQCGEMCAGIVQITQ